MITATTSPDQAVGAVRATFGVLCVLLVTLGVGSQIVGSLLVRRGTPPEKTASYWGGGPAFEASKKIHALETAMMVGVGHLLMNMGGLFVYGSVLAGLTINFPTLWIAGALVTAASIVLPISILTSTDLEQVRALRRQQQELFDGLKPDQDGEDYRANLVVFRPDLDSGPGSNVSLLSSILRRYRDLE